MECAPRMHLYPSHGHKSSHTVRVWQRGFWVGAPHLLVSSVNVTGSAPMDEFGGPFAVGAPCRLQLGLNVVEEITLDFPPRPYGELRVALRNVPPGQYNICFQVQTRPSPLFGEPELKLLRTTKKMGVKLGTTTMGSIGFIVGTPSSGDSFLDDEEGDPNTQWVDNSVINNVVFGGPYVNKVRLPKTHLVREGDTVGIFIAYRLNQEGFAKEKPEARQKVGFCWRLEGIR